MVRKLFTIAILTVFIISSAGAYAALATTETENPTAPPLEKTKDRASRAMNNLLYGPVETPANIDESNTKGTQMDRCIPKTRSGVERGIARVVSGVWQLATFWYSDPDCVTKAPTGTTQTAVATAGAKKSAAAAPAKSSDMK